MAASNQDHRPSHAPAPSSATNNKKIRPNLQGTPETLLSILYMRAIDAKAARPILNDRYAVDIVDSMDYNWAKFGLSAGRSAVFAMRGRFLDRWTADFVKAASVAQRDGDVEDGDGVTVLHLAAGLDTRALRICDALLTGQHGNDRRNEGQDRGDASELTQPAVHWIDIDLPEVMDLRRRLDFPRPTGPRFRYEERAIDVAEAKWLADLALSRTKRTMVIMEGLTMYLTPEQGRGLIEQLTSYFVSSASSSSPAAAAAPQRKHQMCFDCMSPLYMAMQRFDPILTQTGSNFSWLLDDLHELEEWDEHGRLRLADAVFGCDHAETRDLGWKFWLLCWVCSWIPALRRLVMYVRYEW
ncbi:S-adenosyl-L-methionine-dependent methyltransferase [Coniella lustricola]|uniref:S-adenosyl-L-methionine-dependent methyltransferase n=1 Tax=Coniella lustricola TaxID=2025994 RepID=A0A2T3AG54_9PEZI|nr:S-adenosyl-L-methionine-dependent methyltransferase [Coniella lustricola]